MEGLGLGASISTDYQSPTEEENFRKLIIVDNFDHLLNEGNAVVTLGGGKYARILENRLVITGWTISSKLLENDQGPLDFETTEVDNVGSGLRYYSSSLKLRKFEVEKKTEWKKQKASGEEKDVAAKEEKRFISHNSIWSVDPDEPIPKETLEEYERKRKLFYVFLAITCFTSVLLVVLLFTAVIAGVKEEDWNEDDIKWKIKHSHKHVHPVESKEFKATFDIHAMIMGPFLILIGTTLLCFRAAPNSSRAVARYVHGSLAIVSSAGSGTGIYFALTEHRIGGWRMGVHGTLGLLTFILLQIQLGFGISIFLIPISSFNLRMKLAPVHKLCGVIVFLLAVATVLTGFIFYIDNFIPQSIYVGLKSKGLLINGLGLCVVIFGMVVHIMVTDPRFRRRKRPEVEGLGGKEDV